MDLWSLIDSFYWYARNRCLLIGSSQADVSESRVSVCYPKMGMMPDAVMPLRDRPGSEEIQAGVVGRYFVCLKSLGRSWGQDRVRTSTSRPRHC